MIVTDSIAVVRQWRRERPLMTCGFVPTMGYLHDGHLALVRRARAENETVAASIYINPTQFAPAEDLSRYPRSLERDLELLAAAGTDLVFTPSDVLMYPSGFQTYVTVEHLSQGLEGAARPLHFRGVATIVTKLFHIVQPTQAYFGQKDFQQTAVVRQLIQDLHLDIAFIVCPTVREADGLAMSSRNSYLKPWQRTAATVLYRALSYGMALLLAGERDANRLRLAMRDLIEAEPAGRLDYVSVADPVTLQELAQVDEQAVLSTAVYFGRTRLIDNLLWPLL